MRARQTLHRRDAEGAYQALVVSINYEGSPIPLSGCERDGERMGGFFRSIGYDVATLSAGRSSNSWPTKDNILAGLRRIARTPGLQRVAFFYAGHGTRIRDRSGDEADGMDEALVCQHPSGPSHMPRQQDLLLDDDLCREIRSLFAHLNVDVTLIFDCCHSGTVCDLPNGLVRGGRRWVPQEGIPSLPQDRYRVLCFSAASDAEVALETAGGGSATNMFLAVVQSRDLRISAFSTRFAGMGLQTPQISASVPLSLDSIVGGTLIPESTPARTIPRITLPVTRERPQTTRKRSIEQPQQPCSKISHKIAWLCALRK